MTELTQDEKLARTKRHDIYIRLGLIVGVLILIFFVWKGCQTTKDSQIAYDSIKNKLQSVIDDTAAINKELYSLRRENNTLQMSVAQMTSNYVITRNELINEADKIKRLNTEIKKAKANKDTLVYYANCDSVVEANEQLIKIVQDALQQTSQVDSLRLLQIKNLNSQISILQTGYDSCVNTVVDVKEKLPSLKPQGKLYVSGGVLWSGPMFGGKAGLTFITKKQLLISGKGLLTNQGVGASVEIGLPLKFKRK